MRTIHRDIVSALILSRDGKLFQGKKDPSMGGVYADCWHIPGGGIDDGEEKIDALVREVREETGIDISSYAIELVDDLGGGTSEKALKETGEIVLCEMKFFVYRIVLVDRDAKDVAVSLNDDLVEFAWTDLTDLGRLKLTPPSVDLFTRLGYLPLQFGSPVGEYPSRPCAYAVVVDDGNVLCLEVRGRYHLPGGGIDAGENPVSAIIREIFEETGYRAVAGKEIGRANQFFPTTREGTPLNKVATFHCASVDRSTGGLGQEADHVVRWVPTDEFQSSTAAEFQKWAVRQTVS